MAHKTFPLANSRLKNHWLALLGLATSASFALLDVIGVFETLGWSWSISFPPTTPLSWAFLMSWFVLLFLCADLCLHAYRFRPKYLVGHLKEMVRNTQSTWWAVEVSLNSGDTNQALFNIKTIAKDGIGPLNGSIPLRTKQQWLEEEIRERSTGRVNLSEGQPAKPVPLFQIERGELRILHEDTQQQFSLGVGRYSITFAAFGGNARPTEKEFRIDFDGESVHVIEN